MTNIWTSFGEIFGPITAPISSLNLTQGKIIGEFEFNTRFIIYFLEDQELTFHFPREALVVLQLIFGPCKSHEKSKIGIWLVTYLSLKR